MKVLIASYLTCCQNSSGGIQNRIRLFHKLLSEKGIDVELFDPFESKIMECDILHVFMPGFECFPLIEYAHKKGVKVVISSVVSTRVTPSRYFYKFLSKLPLSTTFSLQKRALMLGDIIITETPKETELLQNFYGLKNKIELLPNGITPQKYCGKEIFSIVNGDKYILQVGRFDENKNQLNIIKSLKGTDVELVFIGGPDPNHKGYYEKCCNEAASCPNIHFLGWLNNGDPLFQSAYSNATVVVVPSYRETFGMVALEGAVTGASVVFSKTLPILDFPPFKDRPRFAPNNILEIRRVLLEALQTPKDTTLRKRVLEYFSWDVIINKQIEIYKTLFEE